MRRSRIISSGNSLRALAGAVRASSRSSKIQKDYWLWFEKLTDSWKTNGLSQTALTATGVPMLSDQFKPDISSDDAGWESIREARSLFR